LGTAISCQGFHHRPGSWLAPRDFSTATAGGRHSKTGFDSALLQAKIQIHFSFVYLLQSLVVYIQFSKYYGEKKGNISNKDEIAYRHFQI